MATPARFLNLVDPAGQIRPGDTVRTGESRFPQYRVIALDGDRAWIRNLQYGDDHIVPVDCCRKVGPAPLKIR
jgi:hypothetical protein